MATREEMARTPLKFDAAGLRMAARIIRRRAILFKGCSSNSVARTLDKVADDLLVELNDRGSDA